MAVRLIRFLDCSSNRVGSTTRTGYHIDNRDAICPFRWKLERVIAGINVIVYHIVPFVIRLANINALPKQSPRFLLNISRDLTFGCFSGNPLGSRSYCDVYENSVVGMTALSMNQPNMPMQKFAINYSEINNVTETGKTICIYTVYATYEVLALHNRSEAVNEIRKRISKNAEK